MSGLTLNEFMNRYITLEQLRVVARGEHWRVELCPVGAPVEIYGRGADPEEALEDALAKYERLGLHKPAPEPGTKG